MDHPFWKTRFIIRDAEQLRKLTDSVIKEVWIDPEKGLDVAEEAVALPTPTRVPTLPAAVRPAPAMASAGGDTAVLPAQPAARPAPTSTPIPPPSRSFAEE